MSENGEQRRSRRYNASIQLAFSYAGAKRIAITTDVSPQGATIVSPALLPPGAIVVFEVQGADKVSQTTDSVIKLVAQVIWSGPAPFGGSESYAAGLELMRASAPTWSSLIAFMRDELGADPRMDRPKRIGSGPAFDLRKNASRDTETPEKFEVLFNIDDVWFRGALVFANPSTMWIATIADPPGNGSPIQVRIGIKSQDKHMALMVTGHVPGGALADNETKGWIFECEIESLSETEVYAELLRMMENARLPG